MKRQERSAVPWGCHIGREYLDNMQVSGPKPAAKALVALGTVTAITPNGGSLSRQEVLNPLQLVSYKFWTFLLAFFSTTGTRL
jgi:hypothetical protein